MIPHIFVSSTIDDLHHLRDAVRDAVTELAYQPVMSEYGDIGYLPGSSAVDSCYRTVRECQLAVVILGKRYRSQGTDGISITHHEFRVARKEGVPIFCLVDREVWFSKKIFDANGGDLAIPGMDAPEQTFAFITEVVEAPTNNAILPFTTASEARSLIKTQIAHFVGDLLRAQHDPMKADVKDILAEMKTLRHELTGGTDKQAPSFIRALRLLLDDNNKDFRGLVEQLFETLEDGVPQVIRCRTFDEFVEAATGTRVEIVNVSTHADAEGWIRSREGQFRYSIHGGTTAGEPASAILVAISMDRKHVFANPSSLEDLRQRFQRIRDEATAV